jgi:hypothetical protein
MPFTCANRRYRTNDQKGYPHGPGQPNGSVFDSPIANGGDHSLWLEHVIEPRTGAEMFWLMWYDRAGRSTIPESAVFNEDDIRELGRKFSSLIRVP